MKQLIYLLAFTLSLFSERAVAQPLYSFMVIHCDPPEVDPEDPCGYPGVVHMQKLGAMVHKADAVGAKLTIQLSAAWVDSILADPVKLDTVRAWRDRGHEIAAHHHHFGHQFWDGYMNDSSYADSIPSGCGVYLGQTEDFYDKLRLICGDSLLLTLGQGPSNDPDFLAQEWSDGIIYKTNDRSNQPPPLGGRVTEDAFSNVEQDTMGVFVTCKLSYCFVDDQQMGYDSLYEMLNKINDPAYASYRVVGAVTHVFNFVPPLGDTIFNYWLDTITQLLPVMTVREIMRAENCMGETLTTGLAGLAANLPELLLYPNPVKDELYITGEGAFSVSEARVYAMDGTLLLKHGLAVQKDFYIDVSCLPAGIYLLQLTSGEKVVCRRFVKG